LYRPLRWRTALAAGTARADDYPSRPIRLIVPYAAGGGADGVGASSPNAWARPLDRPIVIENRGGAGSIIVPAVNKSEPDGYTLLLGQSGPISIKSGGLQKAALRPVKDFAPICMTTASLHHGGQSGWA